MTERRKYKKAFQVACELLNGAILYGYDSGRIFSEMMKKDGVVSSFSYEEFILNNLDRLTRASQTGGESELTVQFHWMVFKNTGKTVGEHLRERGNDE